MNKNFPDSPNNPTQKSNSSVTVVQESFALSGPLPPPEILRKFDEVVPGSAERIIKMAEGQFAHRTELERKVIDSDIVTSKRGQILGFVIAIVGLICSMVISIFGNKIAGALIGVGTLASLVSVFMYGSKARSKELQKKTDTHDE